MPCTLIPGYLFSTQRYPLRMTEDICGFFPLVARVYQKNVRLSYACIRDVEVVNTLRMGFLPTPFVDRRERQRSACNVCGSLDVSQGLLTH